MKKNENSSIAGGKVKSYGHYGKLFGGSLND
jgi:hypothetical protein